MRNVPLAVLSTLLLLPACQKSNKTPPAEVQGPATVSPELTPPAPPSVGSAASASCTSHLQCEEEQRCCGGECRWAECCGDEECEGRLCRDGACAPCTEASQCGAGEACCGGLCTRGACCSAADCEGGQACRAHQCIECRNDGHCGPGQRCCGGACLDGDCCESADCDGRLCLDHRCRACEADPECEPGQQCCQGRCAMAGTCGMDKNPRAVCDPACGGPTPLCCGGMCLAGQCCTHDDCAAFPTTPSCIDFVCRKCSVDQQCAPGEKCCQGACSVGDCCPGQACSGGQACVAYHCSACTKDSDCGQAGLRCCGDVCVKGECCSSSDCAGGAYVCVGGQCEACTSDDQCAAGSRCCAGACVAGAQCCLAADCLGGKICSRNTHTCVACQSKTQCGEGDSGWRCCGGACSMGTCCNNADCQAQFAGAVCGPDGTCKGCENHDQCGGADNNKLCCAGECVEGACCSDDDCSGGQQCINGGCGACTTSSATDVRGTCSVGEVCCGPSAATKSCRRGSCCADADCTESSANVTLVCDGNACQRCDDSVPDLACESGSKCCSGACVKGITCCDDADCDVGEVCTAAGQCSICAQDSDCGGGMECCPANDGSAAKYCKPFCTTTMPADDPADLDQGTGDGVFQGPSDLDPINCSGPASGKLCLSGKPSRTDTNYIWVPGSSLNMIQHYNADTLEHLGNINVVGGNPSRTGINTTDQSIWVGCRGPSGVVHIGVDNKVVCYAAFGSQGVRAVAVASTGNAWIGDYGDAVMIEFSGSEVGPINAHGVPECKRTGRQVYVGGSPYGAATDKDDNVWVANGGVAKVNVAAQTASQPITLGRYGMTVDRDYVWIGYYGGGQIHRCALTGGCSTINTGANPRGISVHPTDGRVYAGSGSNTLAIVDRSSLAFEMLPILDERGQGFGHMITAAVDGAGRVWAVDYNSSKAVRYEKGAQACSAHTGCATRWCWDGKCAEARTIGLATNPYAYTDLTGIQSLIAHVQPGSWTRIFDAGPGVTNPYWTQITLRAKIPAKTTVAVRARVNDKDNAFSATNLKPATPAWYPADEKNPYINVASTDASNFANYRVPIIAVNTSANAGKRRYIQLEVRMETKDDATTPVIDWINVEWSPDDPSN